MADPLRHADAVRLARRDFADDLHALETEYPGSTVEEYCVRGETNCIVTIDRPEIPQDPLSNEQRIMRFEVRNWIQGLYRKGELLDGAAKAPPVDRAPSG